MKFNLREIPDPVTNSFLMKFMKKVIIPAVCGIRSELATRYDVTSKPYKDYRGLCNEASDIVSERLKRYIDTYFRDSRPVRVRLVHGEQKHSPRIPSLYWEMEHTWVEVRIRDKIIYVDPTSSQFQDIYPSIPDYYVSLTPPRWFLADKNSLVFGFGHKINQKIKVPARVCINKKMCWRKIGICEFLVYHILATISDTIRGIASIFHK